MSKYEGIARFYKDVAFDIELTEEQFDNGEWYHIALNEAQKNVTSKFNSECDGVDIEAEDLELIE